MPAKKSLLDPVRLRNFQDVLYGLIVTACSVALMLFLIGSADILSSLAVIGVLMCLSLTGSSLRFISMTRADRDLKEQQDRQDLDVRVLQHRVNDHDLMLLDLVGRTETMANAIDEIKGAQVDADKNQRAFMGALKDRIIQLVTVLSARKQAASAKAPPPAAKKKTAFLMAPAKTANDAPKTIVKQSRYDDDIIVSPSLVRDALYIALKTQRVDVYAQPIASLPQRQLHAIEIYGRIRFQSGVYISARDYRGVAAHQNQLHLIDRLVLQELVKLQLPPTVPVFINLCRESLLDRDVLRHLIQMQRLRPELAGRLVIQMTQKDFDRLDSSEEKVVAELKNLRIHFAVNDIQSPDLDLNRVAALGFKFIKLPQERLLTGPDSDMGAGLIQRFMTRLQARGIELIVGSIETDAVMRRLLDYPVHYAQGYLFGKPDRPAVYTAPKKVA
jgi:cyclic-di-GMP phosphodiesterase, flagellum assembly factor TipF